MKKYLFLFLCVLTLGVLTSQDVQAQDYTNFAQCLKSKGTVMYGGPKCGHCKRFIKQFNGAFEQARIPFKNCKGRDAKECRRVGVRKFPMFAMSNGQKISRPHSLEELANFSGCSLSGAPVNASPQQERPQQRPAPIHQQQHNHGQLSPDAIAQCLQDQGVKFYGGPECSKCRKNKQWFGESFSKINSHNCLGSSAERAECRKYRTYPFPTYLNIKTGKRLVRPHGIDEVAKTFGCTMPAPQPQQQFVKPAVIQEEPVEQQQNLGLTDDDKLSIGRCLGRKNLTLYLNQNQNLSRAQLTEIGPAANFINIVNCTNSSEGICSQMYLFPTWVYNGTKISPNFQELETLARITNCK